MDHYCINTAADVLNTLKGYRDELRNQSLRKPHWPLLERLISRKAEMGHVWENIARQGLSCQQCQTLLEQVFFAGAYGTDEQNTRLKSDYRRLVELNVNIASKAEELAAMLTEREDIHNRNAFSLEHTTHLVDLIDAASEQNGHYRSFLQEPLDGLRSRFNCKYWPSLQQLLQVAAHETPDAEFLYRSEEAIVGGRGQAVPDYIRKLFEHIENARNSHWGLPDGFTLSDDSLATLATVSLDRGDVSADRVKTLRHRLNREGYPGAWATKKKQCLR